MDLHVTLVAPRSGEAAPASEELVVTFPGHGSGLELAEALARARSISGITVSGCPLEALTPGIVPLVNGAVLLSGGIPSPEIHEGPPLLFAVRSGPGAGSVFPLPRGTHEIGRFDGTPAGDAATISLPDPELSRLHARLSVAETSVTLTDAGSSNGTRVDGRRVRSTIVQTGQPISMGASICTLELAGDVRLDATAGGPHGETLRIPHHERARSRAGIIAMAVLPVVIAVGMAVATGQWAFLALSGASAATALFPLIEGRASRRAFARRISATIEEDLARRLLAAPDASELCRAPAVTATAGAPTSPVMLRVGTGRQDADIVIDPPNGKPAPHHAIAPVTVPLADAVSLRGASESVEGLVRFTLLQLAIVPSASGMRVLLAGGVSELLFAARFLPRTSIVTHEMLIDPSKIHEALAACGRAAVVILPGLPGTAARSLVDAAIAQGACIVDAAGVCDTSGTTIYVHGSSAHLRARRRELDFVPDLVPMRAFSHMARRWGAQAHMDDGGMLPARCSLDEIIGLREADLIQSWTRTASAPNRPSLRIPLGTGSSGTTALDLISDGPHVLVAGTTGSGKSEFLRTLIAGAAASHTPDRLTFLLMDFKGGSGLEPLAGLPHCVGLVSDLEGCMDRTLISLRAELDRRERQLAATRCADLDEYSSRASDHEPLPRLVIVIDEFRMLIDQAPDALAELMRVATIGRSLGLHLVMATQRPQGAVSADIRANVGCVIALRVASEAESRDVIGSPAAAHIPALVPGRALISVAGADPLPFQTASLGLAGRRAQQTRIVRAEQWMSSTAHDDSPSARASSAQAAAPFVAVVLRAWRTLGGRAPRRPVAAPLPASARPPDPAEGTLIPLGIADSPHRQRTGVLNWDPENDGHLALIGEPAGGSASALSAIAAQLAAGQRERHLYLLDADGALEGLQCHARVGAHVNLQDARRAARVIARLVEEGSNRRARPISNGISARVNQPSEIAFRSEIENGSGAARPAGQGNSASASSPCGPTLFLVVAGWGSWIAAFRQGQPWVEDALLELVRSGPACGIVVLVAGARELVSSRAFAGLPGRLYFPRGTTDEARYDWPKVPSTAWEAGRAIASGVLSPETAVAVQCFDALPLNRPQCSGSSYGSRTLLSWRSPGQPTDSLPFRIVPLPRLAVAAEIAGRRNARRDTAVRTRPVSLFLTVGLAGDEADPLALRVRRGELFLVLGAPGSGKSSFLAALPAMNPELRWHRASSARSSSDAASAASRDVSSTLLPVLLVDDADRLDAAETRAISDALDAGVIVVATAGYSPNLYSRCQLALQARSTGAGIAICPRTSSDAEVFGVRIDPPGHMPPGRAFAVLEGQAIEVQLGHEPAPHR